MFIRQYELAVGTAEEAVIIKDLQMKFKIKRTADPQHDTCEVEIYNLSKQTIAVFDKDDVLVQLRVGYRDQPLQLLFRGTKTFMTTSKEEVDVKTTIQIADGVVATREGKSAVSLPEGTTLRKIIKQLVDDGFGSEIKDLKISDDILDKTYNNGYSATGSAKKNLDDIIKANGLTYKIENNQSMVVWKAGKDTGESAILLTPDNGLISSPESMAQEIQKLKKQGGTSSPAGIRFKCLLNPSLAAGNNVKIEGTFNRDGVYTIQSVSHQGGYEDDEWQTEIEAIASTGSK